MRSPRSFERTYLSSMDRTPYSPPQATVTDISPAHTGDARWAALGHEKRSAFFWACMRRAFWMNVLLFAMTFASRVVITAVVAVVARINGVELARYATVEGVVSWIALAFCTFAAIWWYTRWLIGARVGSLRVVLRDDGEQPPNNASQVAP